MAKHLSIDDGEDMQVAAPPNPAPYGYLKDGITPRRPPGRPKLPPADPAPAPEAARAVPPLRRLNPRPVPREQTREMAREPSRANAVVMGRNGEMLTRGMTDFGGDVFERVPPEKWPEGWVYQWNAVSALNKELDEIIAGHSIDMNANGWRPVPASRHPGVWTPIGYEGAIVVKHQRLEERPKTLNDEAQYEDHMRAQKQTRDQTDALRLTQSKLPGAEVGARGNKVAIKVDRSFTADIPRPQHIIDEE